MFFDETSLCRMLYLKSLHPLLFKNVANKKMRLLLPAQQSQKLFQKKKQIFLEGFMMIDLMVTKHDVKKLLKINLCFSSSSC